MQNKRKTFRADNYVRPFLRNINNGKHTCITESVTKWIIKMIIYRKAK